MKNYNSSREIIIFIPSIEFGGVERNLHLTINFLSKFYPKLYLVTSSKVLLPKSSKKIKIVRPKTNFWTDKSRLIKNFVCLFLLFKFFQRNKFLIFSFQSSFFSILASKIMNWPVILRLNTSPEKYIQTPIKTIFFKLIYSSSTEIIVNSLEFKKNLKKILNLNSRVILNPFIIKKTKKKKINRLKNYKGLKILSIGRLTDQKDHLTLLKSAKFLIDECKYELKLFIIGQGKNLKMLKSFIYNNNLKKKIILLGYKKDAFDYIKSFDLFILSSRYEGLPNSLIEAQISGVPIISSDCPSGPKEILLNGKLGILFKTGDDNDLSKKIKLFCKNKKKYKNKAILAKKYLKRFDYDKNLNKLKKILNKHLT